MAEDGTDWEKRYKDLQRYAEGLKEDAENWRTFTTDARYKPALDLIKPLEEGTYKAPSAEAPKQDDGSEPTWFKPYAEQLKAERKKRFDEWLEKQETWEKNTKAKYPELGDDFFGASGKLAQAMKRIGTDDPEEAFRIVAPPSVLVKYYAPTEPLKEKEPSPKADAPLGGKPSESEGDAPPRSWEEAVERGKARLAASS